MWLLWIFPCRAKSPCSQWAFVHIPKTGGTSVVSMLTSGPRKAVALLRSLDACSCRAWHHSTALEQQFPSSALSFAIVRNPFDYMVSLYFYNLRQCAENKTKCPEPTFDRWLVNADIVGNRTGRFIADDLLGDPRKIGGKEASQRAWITDDADRVLVKRVVRLEDKKDFRDFSTIGRFLPKICNVTNLNLTKKEAPHLNPSTHAHRSFYYTDPFLCGIVARRFRVDFRSFGYDATNCTGLL